MSKEARIHAARREINWTYRPTRELTKDVSVVVFDNRMGQSDALPIVVLAGYGQGKRALRKTVSWLGEKGHEAVGVHLPFNQVPGKAAEAVGKEVLHVVGDFLKEESGVPLDSPLMVVGDSQGGGAWGVSREARPEGLGDAALVQPLGLRIASDRLGKGKILGRFIKNTFRQPMTELETHRMNFDMTGQLIWDVISGRFVPKFDYALSLSLQEQVSLHLASGRRVGVFTSDRDPVFPEKEIRRALATVQRGPDIFSISGLPHVTLTTSPGKRMLHEAFSYLKQAA